ncbi:MAG: hypothetical protein RLZ56_544 [Bacteroidota bacterium]|jgi:hypothetical protein
MKKIVIALLTFAIFTQVQAQHKWVSLFDGKTTNGWHSYGETTPGAAWKALDGVLILDPTAKVNGKGGGDLVTNESFNDFHLQLEWKISKNGNSGIMFFVQDNPSKYEYSFYTGPEFQVLDNEGHPDAKIISHRAGNLYDLIVGNEGHVKPYGEWNKVDIISSKGVLELKMNEVTVVKTHLGDDAWKELIRRSKFGRGDMPDFGKVFSGHIVLQDHGNEVAYRNIRIQKL